MRLAVSRLAVSILVGNIGHAAPVLAQEAAVAPTTILDCALAPGTSITAFAASGGSGSSIKWSIPPKARDFTLSGSVLVVAPGGITAADCGKTNTITVSGTFTYAVKALAIPNLVADDSTTALQADDSTNELMGQ